MNTFLYIFAGVIISGYQEEKQRLLSRALEEEEEQTEERGDGIVPVQVARSL